MKVTVQFELPNALYEQELKEDFEGNLLDAYKAISNNLSYCVTNFTTDSGKILKIERL